MANGNDYTLFLNGLLKSGCTTYAEQERKMWGCSILPGVEGSISLRDWITDDYNIALQYWLQR